jgi:hypothetical protein
MPRSIRIEIKVFGPLMRVLFIVIAVMTIALEIVPLRPMSILCFYSYKAAKGLLFLSLGCITPLALWRFDSMNKGLVFAAVSATLVETAQRFVVGHHFSIFELLAKLILLVVGFLVAMNALYERRLRLLGVEICLVSEHLSPRNS